MGFKFTSLCDLLSQLEENRVVKATTVKPEAPDIQTVAQWFHAHERRLHHPETDALAFLSCLFPERRPDRVYGLQAASLARIIGRCLGLGSSRLSELNRWRTPGGPDLGQCVENVLRQAENPLHSGKAISTEEINQTLDQIASRCRFSAPRARRQQGAVDIESALSPLYQRLSSRDAKWLTRMILKNYAPITLPENFTLSQFHVLLPHLLQFQNNFESALHTLSLEPMNKFPPRPDRFLIPQLCSAVLEHLQPRIGYKIGRPEYYKARSTKHCYDLIKGRRMSLERKYDGEYCQIHVDLTNKQSPYQIFSKSGKDSSADRAAIIPTLTRCLNVGAVDCKFKTSCILEGELVVWDEELGGIADFHKLRKHLPRSGTFLGIESDSPPQPYEHLMVIFFDILLLDDNICLRAPHHQRRLLLQDVVQSIHGHAAIAEQEVVDFNRTESRSQLENSFARAIAQRWEGLILKASDEPYFSIHTAGMNDRFGRWIKLKKDYIPGLGDTVDLLLVGASYNAQDAAALTFLQGLQWTHFLVGCLFNKDAVVQRGARPHFRVVDVVDRHGMHWKTLQLLNQLGQFQARDPETFDDFHIEMGRASLPVASVIFQMPFIVEMLGSGFEKPSGARYFSLRFPRILKLHDDRSMMDAASFRELQILAEDARAVPVDELSQEQHHWRKRLKVGNGLNQYIVQRSRTPSTASVSSTESAVPEISDTTMSAHEAGLQSVLAKDFARKASAVNPNQNPTMDRKVQTHLTREEEGHLSHKAGQTKRHRRVLSKNQNLSNCRTGKQDLPEHACEINGFVSKSQVRDLGVQPHVASAKAVGAQHKDHAAVGKDAMEDTQRQDLTISVNHTPVESVIQPNASPLTTIPVYLSGQSSETGNLSDRQDSSNLSQFLEALLSEETRLLFKISNPRAASQEAVFGIALVNRKVLPLGQLIHKIAKALVQLVSNKVPSQPNKGRIFFLDASFLAEDVCPDDLRFCLRNTWRELAPRFFYACLYWTVNGQDSSVHESGQADDVLSSSREVPQGPKNKHLVSFYVSFDLVEILALGEHTSPNGSSDPHYPDI
ncbi:hypothetical protein PDE_09904 [Penicillium oxalicum 114-2]|uniref:ATP-dependent DNA ligase family profile domain-containing protein n=1 Tax=Penicillium oxalicum (strain 114-2 / CGMCC 5302) TaxID=933388 RepID=S7ZWW8_PENO1|nr:hypothetical protein PDE_09904 [Penicillium oxalicum 114-2]